MLSLVLCLACLRMPSWFYQDGRSYCHCQSWWWGKDIEAVPFCGMCSTSSIILQDTFDIRILMAKSVKYTVNFLEAKEGDLHR